MTSTRGSPIRVAALLGAGLVLCPATGVAQRRATVAEVQVSPPDAQVAVGRTAPFFATAFDNAGNPVATATFTWTSSNARAATIDQNGIATGLTQGITIITARTGSGARAKTGQATLQVLGEGATPQPQAQPGQPAPQPHAAAAGRPTGPGCAAWEREPNGSGVPEAIIVNPLRIVLVRGESKPLDFRAVRGDGENADRVCIQFAIDPGGERVAAVDSFGVVVATGDTGRAMVRATVAGKTGWQPKQISVEVRGDSVRFEKREESVSPGTIDTLLMVVPSQSGRRINPVGIFQFTSSDTSRVRVSPVAPVVQAVGPGSARIMAQSSVYPDIVVTVNVHRQVARLIGAPLDTLMTLAIGGSGTIRAQALAADSTPIPEVPLRWTLPDSTVVRFDTATKALRGVKMGDTRIAVSAPIGRDSNVTRAWHVRVVAGGLLVSRSRLALGIGDRTPISVQLLDDRRHPIGAAADLTWTSSNDSVARVTDGQIVGVGMGQARLSAKARWDSTATSDVFVVGDLIVSALRGGRWDLYMLPRGDPLKTHPLTQDSALESQATWSPTAMQVAYVAAPNPGSITFDLYVANADGSEARRLTDDSALVRAPVFVRPSGEQIVFESNKGGRPQLYVINRDGTGRRALTTGDTPNTQPDVSSDGKKLLFVSLRETAPRERNYDVYMMNLDGTGELRLTTSPRPDDSPAFAADGRSFYYLRDEGGTPPTKRVYRQDLTTSVATAVTPVGLFVQAFSVSADGSTMALTILQADPSGAQSAHVALFNISTGAMTPLTLPGVDRLAGPAFRPAIPAPPQH